MDDQSGRRTWRLVFQKAGVVSRVTIYHGEYTYQSIEGKVNVASIFNLAATLKKLEEPHRVSSSRAVPFKSFARFIASKDDASRIVRGRVIERTLSVVIKSGKEDQRNNTHTHTFPQFNFKLTWVFPFYPYKNPPDARRINLDSRFIFKL